LLNRDFNSYANYRTLIPNTLKFRPENPLANW